MAIKNYTTSVDEHKTVSEIQALLARKGATHINVRYLDGVPQAIEFVIGVPVEGKNVPVPFRLPCNFDGVFRAIAKNYKDRQARNRFERNPESKAQSRRIAWRIIKDWIDSQLALVEAEQAQMAEVFLPYAINGAGRTMFQGFVESQQRLLAEGSQSR